MVRGVDMEKRTVDFSLVDEVEIPLQPVKTGRGQWDETRPYPASDGHGRRKGFHSAKGTGSKKARKEKSGKGKKGR